MPLKDVRGRDVFSNSIICLRGGGVWSKLLRRFPFGFLDHQEQGFHRVEVHQVLDLTRSSLTFLQ